MSTQKYDQIYSFSVIKMAKFPIYIKELPKGMGSQHFINNLDRDLTHFFLQRNELGYRATTTTDVPGCCNFIEKKFH